MRLLLSTILSLTSFIPSILAARDMQDDLMAERLRPKKYVLSIGIQHFQDELWRDLRFAGKDARDIYQSFLSEQTGFDGGQVLNSTEQRGITRSEITKAFDRIAEANRNEDDTVVVYLSTHGTVGYKKNGQIGRYVITSDTDSKRLADTALDYDELIERFNQLKSRKKVLILAFCHSGVGKSALTASMKRALARLKSSFFEEPMQSHSEGSIILTASGWREPAIEDDKLENDVYTHFLIKGFQQDMNSDGAVSITEAHQYAAQQTYKWTSGRQRPSAILELLGADPVIIAGKVKKSETASIYSLLDRFSGLQVLIDGQEKGTLEKGLVVPEGKVRLTLKDPGSSKVVTDRVVNFEAGREYSVANFLIPQLPNTLTLGVDNFYIADQVTRDGYLPTQNSGFRLNYRRDELISIYDLDLSLSYFPSVREEINATSSQSITQTRTLLRGGAQLGLRDPVRFLSTDDRAIRSELRWAAGPSFLYVDRQVDEIAFYQRDASYFTGGLQLTTGLDVILSYHLVKFSLELNGGFYQNFADEGPSVLSVLSANASIGTFW